MLGAATRAVARRRRDGEVQLRSGSRSGSPSYNLSVTFGDSSPSRGASGEMVKLCGMPRPPLDRATATTAASGGNRESLLGQRPARRKRERSGCWEPQPGRWHAAGVTERFSSAAAHGQALLRTTSQSPSVTAPLVGEPLAKRAGFRVTAKLPMSERRKKAPLELPLLGGVSFGEAIRSSAVSQSSTRAAASSFVRRLRTAK